MKRLLLFSLFLVQGMLATAQWTPVVNPGFSSAEAYFTSLSISPDGVPYVAYMDLRNGDKATVLRYNSAKDAWVTVGNADFSSAEAYNTSLALSPDGVPFVAYLDGRNGTKATVMKYNSAKDEWETVGNAGFSAGDARYPSLAFSPDGVPFVAYQDAGNGNKATVMVYDSITTASLSGTYCSGTSVQVNYNARGYYRTNNSFTAQLSDYAGSFTTPVSIGTPASGGSGAIQATIPPSTQAGSGYRIRVVASNPAVTGSDNGTDLLVRPLTNYYPDADKDGYGNATTSPIQACSPPSGYVPNNTDCNDANASINPGAVELCDGIDNNCNGQTDEGCSLCRNATGLTTTNITNHSAQLNWVASISPAQWQIEYKTTGPGSKWIPLNPIVGSARSTTISGLIANQNYNWHIKGLCVRFSYKKDRVRITEYF